MSRQTILITLLVVSSFLLMGCGLMRQTLLDISEEELKNAETARELAKNYLEIWPIQSGLIRGSLGSRLEEMPTQATNAMDELDDLSARCADPNDCSDYDLGLSLGLRVRLLGSVVQEALKVYAPDVIDVIPLVF